MKRILFLSLIIVGLIFISAFLYLKTFLTTAQLSFSQLTQIITTGWNSRSPERVNFLLLGLDQRSDEMESTLLTDTILFASLNPQSGKLLLVPLPRDLWIKNYRTKINSLYFYNKIDYIQTVLGQPVHHTLILNYHQLPQLIDLLGGIEVSVDKGFTDSQYPQGSSFTTISFSPGTQTLNGDRTLQYIRSRQSEDIEEGTDLARNQRQMQVFNALINKLRTKSVLANPTALGKLYRYWQDNITTDLSDPGILAVLFSLFPQVNIQITSQSLPSELLTHPPVRKYGLWVWEPRDPTWSQIHQFIAGHLK